MIAMSIFSICDYLERGAVTSQAQFTTPAHFPLSLTGLGDVPQSEHASIDVRNVSNLESIHNPAHTGEAAGIIRKQPQATTRMALRRPARDGISLKLRYLR